MKIKMGGLLYRIVVICTLVNIADGFDFLAFALIAPAIAKEWTILPAELGFLLAAASTGQVVGTFVLSILSDKFGRKNSLIIAIVIMASGMFLSALAQNTIELWGLRLLTGVATGGAVVINNTIGAEHAPPKYRTLSMSIMTTGVPIGLIVGGIVAIPLVALLGWRAVLAFGGVVTLLLLAPVLAFVPESEEFVHARQLDQELSGESLLLVALRKILHDRLLIGTILASICAFSVNIGLYYVLAWTPTVLVDAGLAISGGMSGLTLISVGGAIGAIAYGLAAVPLGVKRAGPVFMVMSFVTASILALAPVNLSVVLPLSLVVGFFVLSNGPISYTLAASVYPAVIRGTGAGLVIGMGRIGSIVGPVVAGFLIGAGLPRAEYSIILAVPFLIGGAALIATPLFRQVTSPAAVAAD